MTENTTSKSTNELLMRVIAVESPELFDGSEDELVRVTSYNYSEYCPAACETCGDEPEMLTIGYVTRNGREGSETYDYFGLTKSARSIGRVGQAAREGGGEPWMTLQSRRVSSLQVTASRPQTSRISSLLGILTRTHPSTVRS